MEKLALHNYYLEKGAEFIESGGYTVPKSFLSIADEYTAAKNGVGVFDLSSRGKIRLSGKECFKFMQGMLSNDVINLESGKGVHATLLTVKGRMIADLYIYKDGDEAIIDMEQGLNESIAELFLKYRLSYRAKIDDITKNYIQLCFIGPKSAEYLSKLLDEDLSALDNLGLVNKNIDDAEIIVIKIKRSLYSSFDLYVPAEKVDLIPKTFLGEQNNIKPQLIGHDTYELLRVEAGIPKYGVDMDEKTIPIEAGLWDALNFEKGCYIGQEVIARIKWRGHVNRHLVGIELDFDKPVNPEDRIVVDDKEVGFITSSVYSFKKNSPVCMGYIRKEYKEPETAVYVISNDKRIEGKVFEFNN